MSNLPENSGAPMVWVGCVFVLLVGILSVCVGASTKGMESVGFLGVLIIGFCILVVWNRMNHA